MSNRICPFCAALREEEQMDMRGHSYEYGIALVRDTYRMPTRNRSARYERYGFKLNYCPQCGERIPPTMTRRVR